jgi:hypothetical protein
VITVGDRGRLGKQTLYDGDARETSTASMPLAPSRCSKTTFAPSVSDLYPPPTMLL